MDDMNDNANINLKVAVLEKLLDYAASGIRRGRHHPYLLPTSPGSRPGRS